MGRVLQVSGHAGTGKTQLMLQLALQIAQQGCQVHCLASSAGHSSPLLASRLVQLTAGACSDSKEFIAVIVFSFRKAWVDCLHFIGRLE